MAASAPTISDSDSLPVRRNVDNSTFEWPFEQRGKARRVSVNGPVMVNTLDLALRAAVDGLGIAYTAEALAEPFLRATRPGAGLLVTRP